jgi:hypothetical protein
VRGPAAALLLAALAAAAAPLPAVARELWRSGEMALEFSGSVRQIGLATQGTDFDDFRDVALANPLACGLAATFPDCPAFEKVNQQNVGQSLTRLRLRFDLAFPRGFSATLVYDNEIFAGVLDTLEGNLAEGFDGDDTFLGWERDIHMFGLREDNDHLLWRHRVYRGFVSWENERFRISVGRQRIAWGVGRLWNPIDRFNAIPPLAIEPDQSPGVDSIDVRWMWSGFTYLQAVYAPETSRDDAKYALRLHGVLRDVDYSVMAGVFEEARTVGLDLATNLGDAAFRLEAVYTDPRRDVWRIGAPRPGELSAFWQIDVSLDHNFDVGSGLYVLLEHLWNDNARGFGRGRAAALLPFFETTATPPPGAPAIPGALFVEPASRAILGGSRVVTSARHTTGLNLSYELSTALRGDLLLLYDWNGGSAAFAPRVVFDGWSFLELTLGAQLFSGRRRSQYGDQEAIFFLIGEVFF